MILERRDSACFAANCCWNQRMRNIFRAIENLWSILCSYFSPNFSINICVKFFITLGVYNNPFSELMWYITNISSIFPTSLKVRKYQKQISLVSLIPKQEESYLSNSALPPWAELVNIFLFGRNENKIIGFWDFLTCN